MIPKNSDKAAKDSFGKMLISYFDDLWFNDEISSTVKSFYDGGQQASPIKVFQETRAKLDKTLDEKIKNIKQSLQAYPEYSKFMSDTLDEIKSKLGLNTAKKMSDDLIKINREYYKNSKESISSDNSGSISFLSLTNIKPDYPFKLIKSELESINKELESTNKFSVISQVNNLSQCWCSEQKIFYYLLNDEESNWRKELIKKHQTPNNSIRKLFFLIHTYQEPCSLCCGTADLMLERFFRPLCADMQINFDTQFHMYISYREKCLRSKDYNEYDRGIIDAFKSRSYVSFCQVCSSSSSVPNSAE